jgi:ferredoxin--NADP+ reductase
VVGSGPAAFYVTEDLFKRLGSGVQVDMYERLPTPFGLVRFGVAPDHQKIKTVTRVFEKAAANPGFRFFGNVDIGPDIDLATLRRHYHQICFATGAQTDRRLGIPGEDLERSHPATEFVAWYNGHPDFRDRKFDLSVESVAVVGVGNVAVDVARILCRTMEELETTDIADYALEALEQSRVRDVYVVGRRGPAQAAFTNPEIRELGNMCGADLIIREDEAVLDPLSQAEYSDSDDRDLKKKVEIIQDSAGRPPSGKPRRLTLRFLVSPVELIGNEAGEVEAMRLVRNRLHRAEDGRLRPVATDETETLPVGLVFRSVGYHGVPITDLPFDQKAGIIPNQAGRVMNGGSPEPGLYVSGWIKRGPSGVIGTNKPDAKETVACMHEDMTAGATLMPATPDTGAIEDQLRAKGIRAVSYEDWRKLDELEIERGQSAGRPRVKFTDVEETLAQLSR